MIRNCVIISFHLEEMSLFHLEETCGIDIRKYMF